jgi:hypothetical protein
MEMAEGIPIGLKQPAYWLVLSDRLTTIRID